MAGEHAGLIQTNATGSGESGVPDLGKRGFHIGFKAIFGPIAMN
jgi:hypothetical protein